MKKKWIEIPDQHNLVVDRDGLVKSYRKINLTRKKPNHFEKSIRRNVDVYYYNKGHCPHDGNISLKRYLDRGNDTILKMCGKCLGFGIESVVANEKYWKVRIRVPYDKRLDMNKTSVNRAVVVAVRDGKIVEELFGSDLVGVRKIDIGSVSALNSGNSRYLSFKISFPRSDVHSLLMGRNTNESTYFQVVIDCYGKKFHMLLEYPLTGISQSKGIVSPRKNSEPMRDEEEIEGGGEMSEGDKRKNDVIDDPSDFMKLKACLPGRGNLCGGENVHLMVKVTTQDHYGYYRDHVSIPGIYFGSNAVGGAVGQMFRPSPFHNGFLHDHLQTLCSEELWNSLMVNDDWYCFSVKTPRGDRPGEVDIEIPGMSRLLNGFEYFIPEKKKLPVQPKQKPVDPPSDNDEFDMDSLNISDEEGYDSSTSFGEYGVDDMDPIDNPDNDYDLGPIMFNYSRLDDTTLQLFRLCAKGALDEIPALLEKDPKIIFRTDYRGLQAINVSMYFGHEEVTKYLRMKMFEIGSEGVEDQELEELKLGPHETKDFWTRHFNGGVLEEFRGCYGGRPGYVLSIEKWRKHSVASGIYIYKVGIGDYGKVWKFKFDRISNISMSSSVLSFTHKKKLERFEFDESIGRDHVCYKTLKRLVIPKKVKEVEKKEKSWLALPSDWDGPKKKMYLDILSRLVTGYGLSDLLISMENMFLTSLERIVVQCQGQGKDKDIDREAREKFMEGLRYLFIDFGDDGGMEKYQKISVVAGEIYDKICQGKKRSDVEVDSLVSFVSSKVEEWKNVVGSRFSSTLEMEREGLGWERAVLESLHYMIEKAGQNEHARVCGKHAFRVDADGNLDESIVLLLMRMRIGQDGRVIFGGWKDRRFRDLFNFDISNAQSLFRKHVGIDGVVRRLVEVVEDFNSRGPPTATDRSGRAREFIDAVKKSVLESEEGDYDEIRYLKRMVRKMKDLKRSSEILIPIEIFECLKNSIYSSAHRKICKLLKEGMMLTMNYSRVHDDLMNIRSILAGEISNMMYEFPGLNLALKSVDRAIHNNFCHSGLLSTRLCNNFTVKKYELDKKKKEESLNEEVLVEGFEEDIETKKKKSIGFLDNVTPLCPKVFTKVRMLKL